MSVSPDTRLPRKRTEKHTSSIPLDCPDLNALECILMRTRGMQDTIERCGMKTVTGAEAKELGGKVVYVWKRANGEVLYVGRSIHGIARVLCNHHVIGVLEEIRDDDIFEFYDTDCVSINDLEKNMIRTMNPKLNNTQLSNKPLLKKSVCPGCEQEFEKTRSWHTYCSTKCRTRFNKYRTRSNQRGSIAKIGWTKEEVDEIGYTLSTAIKAIQ